MRKTPSQQILLCFIFLSNLSSRVLHYFSLPSFFASLGQFFVLPVACEKDNAQQHCSPAEQRRAVPALLGPSPIMHHGEEKRNQKEENSLKLSGEKRSECSCHWAIVYLLPWPSVGEGVSSQQEGETTPTPSPPKATLILCCRQKITQERKI